ncbi:uncharacterized skeletal organic matrix protein 5-like isoform X2 [Dendronephthya gigantea]|uniref:uncharacterized skeletal organic matrix protein 5-like isoform X2 n=1 Tax=Dendronephthya gigantea TaxID=151771 RepID=UPI00106BD60C|nr:uncharacterized skeletal organic matrix protein 5-like isoform X2 [Dendronephthya gigantea]
MASLPYFLSLIVPLFILQVPQPGDCSQQAVFRRSKQKYLANNVIETKQAETESECGMYCVRHETCASANYKTSGIGKGRCELNTISSDAEKETNPEFNHLVIVKRSSAERSEEPSQETLNASTITSPIKKEKKESFISCKDILAKYKNSINGEYRLKSNTSDEIYDVYCHMTNITTCGGGGWSLVLKINGENLTFAHHSSLWMNNETLAVQDGLEGLEEKESKLASYWNTPFTKICLGMSYNGHRHWMVFNYTASSLYSVIADRKFTETTAGAAAWKSLISSSNLQANCNKEGFNVRANGGSLRSRIGIFANGEKGCETCESWLGFGSGYYYNGISQKMVLSCGNIFPVAIDDDDDDDDDDNGDISAKNGNKHFAAFGYIFVQ